MLAYQRAIHATCPGRVVAEIGVGLAPLSLMALQAGARRVYGIEQNPEVLELATQLMRSNGFGPDRFIPVLGLSHNVTLPEQVQVLVSELLDAFGIGENATRYLSDARRRHLRFDGVMVPQRLETFLALAEPEVFDVRTSFWANKMKDTYGLDYAAALRHQRHQREAFATAPAELRSPWAPWLDVDFTRKPPSLLAPVVLSPSAPSRVSGIAIAFDCTLIEGVHLRTFSEDHPTHWKQGFQPLPDGAVQVGLDDQVYVELELIDGDRPQTWHRTTVATGKQALIESFAAQRRGELGLPAPRRVAVA